MVDGLAYERYIYSWNDKISSLNSIGEIKNLKDTIERFGVNCVDFYGVTLLHHIIRIRENSVIDFIFEECKPNLFTPDGKLIWPCHWNIWNYYPIQKMLEYDSEGVYVDDKFIEGLYRQRAGYETNYILSTVYKNRRDKVWNKEVMDHHDMLIMLFENHKKRKLTFFMIMLPREIRDVNINKKYRF